FSISNTISYDNRMFNKTNKKEEYLKQQKPFLLKKSGWIDVEGQEEGNNNHFVKNQAQKVCQLIESALPIYSNLFETDDKIFIITPFRTVAESMRKFLVKYFSDKGYDKEILKEWAQKCVGTVHTFQGKDANEVIFVLGCSEKSKGAMNWVVKKANILNVACTRAKYRIAFIGNKKEWEKMTYFRDFIPELIDTIEV
ncbi:MAG: AAA domain-containing protein, partial [Firmicutes bacterium]|nr:AAA domain-containing protein [Bacillota bacterium]